MWKVFVAFNVILFMTGLCSADVHEDHSRSKRFILGGDGVDLESVRKSLIDPSTISNQLTGAIVFPSIMVFGWLTGGERMIIILSSTVCVFQTSLYDTKIFEISALLLCYIEFPPFNFAG